jgi:hypothetical protein
MPTYNDPIKGVSLSEALHEAAVTAPVDRNMLNTFELYHPVGTSDGPIYVVNDNEDLLATKEADADRDAGEEVTFMAGYVRLERPEESDQAATPELALAVDNVSGAFSDALRLARDSLEPWELIERVYASDDTSGPAILPPMRLYLSSVTLTDRTASMTASFGDSLNVAVPKTTFSRSEYPGLVR